MIEWQREELGLIRFLFYWSFRTAEISVISYPNSIKVFDFERLNLGAQP